MILGIISGDEPVVRLNLNIRCSNCKKSVPGGMTVSRRHHDSDGFGADLREFMEGYLCGTCRDKERIAKRYGSQAHAGAAAKPE